jgi:hypothetical protein
MGNTYTIDLMIQIQPDMTFALLTEPGDKLLQNRTYVGDSSSTTVPHASPKLKNKHPKLSKRVPLFALEKKTKPRKNRSSKNIRKIE